MSDCVDLDIKLYCGLCKKKYFNPRLLPCLHSFCSRCLENVEPYNLSSKSESNWTNKSNNSCSSKTVSKVTPPSNYSLSTANSKTISSLTSIKNADSVTILCPLCDLEVELPRGVENLPVNYIIQNKIVLESLNKDTTRVYCDLCMHDIHAVSRCKDCLTNLCAFCSEAHKRQRKTSSHHVLTLQEARKRGINAIHRQIMCPQHTNEEMKLFCGDCDVTVCRDCCLAQHKKHKCDFISDVFEYHQSSVQHALQVTSPKIDDMKKGLENVQNMHKKILVKSAQISEEVNQFIDSWIKNLELHRDNLLQLLKKNCDSKQKQLRIQKIQLEQNYEDFQHSYEVAKEILSQGSEVEILSLKKVVMKRLKVLNRIKLKIEPKVDDKIYFHSQQNAVNKDGFLIQGNITSERICPEECFLKGGGFPAARHGQSTDVLLVTCDSEGRTVDFGGEDIKVEVLNGSIAADVQVKIIDKTDGTYMISLLPIESGQFTANVKVNDQDIQGSPFSFLVKPLWKKHSGIYHCCTFCSSSGRKDIKCGCGAIMPGGYKGCGHGHRGHPGRKHWSCCGNMAEHSECIRTARSMYQFTL